MLSVHHTAALTSAALLAASMSLALVTSVKAQAQTDCAAFSNAIELCSKLAALESASDVGDNSVYRAQLHELKVANYLHLIELNLTLMVQHKCALPREPFTPGDYLMNAHECAFAAAMGHDRSVVCDFGKWTRSPAPITTSPPKPPPAYDTAHDAPTAAEAWQRCTKAMDPAYFIRSIGGILTSPAYDPAYLIESTADGATNHFEFRASLSVVSGGSREWTCSIDYDHGVSKAPVVGSQR
jgi:hypothetical protein